MLKEVLRSCKIKLIITINFKLFKWFLASWLSFTVRTLHVSGGSVDGSGGEDRDFPGYKLAWRSNPGGMAIGPWACNGKTNGVSRVSNQLNGGWEVYSWGENGNVPG